jgi:hypothetical protein
LAEIINGVARAPRDGSYPATEERWFCPNCGTPATCFVSFYRVIVCYECRWLFHVELRRAFDAVQRNYPTFETIEAYAKAAAEQQTP